MKQTSDSNNDIGTYSLAKNHNHINYMFMFIHRKLLHKKKNWLNENLSQKDDIQ